MGRRRSGETTFPLEPLLQVVGTNAARGRILYASDVLGVSPRTLYRWMDYGLTEDDADRLACKLGRHPSEIWPDYNQLPEE